MRLYRSSRSRLKSPLRSVPHAYHATTPYRLRYFFNYSTFSYSMAWWDWSDWQRMIDWMALKGINMPLAVTGQEAIWRDVLKEIRIQQRPGREVHRRSGLSPVGRWMGNIDGLGGPLPDS